MNISKLLKITALSCVAVFSINNNIVNAAEGYISTEEESNAEQEVAARDILNMLRTTPNIQRIQTLQRQGQITPITSVNNCNVNAFQRDRLVLITNNHNLFVYLNGVVVLYYISNDPDDFSNRMIEQSRRESNEDIINMFGLLNNCYEEDGVLDILDENGAYSSMYVVNLIKEVFGDDYNIICYQRHV